MTALQTTYIQRAVCKLLFRTVKTVSIAPKAISDEGKVTGCIKASIIL